MFVVPEPVLSEPGTGGPLLLTGGVGVGAGDPALEPLVTWVGAMLGQLCGQELGGRGAAIRLELVASDRRPDQVPATLGVTPDGAAPGGEWYEVEVGAGGATVRGGTVAGVARGAATLVQLVTTSAGQQVAPVRIVDAPALAWRGLSFDVARRYYEVDDLHRLVDLLALYRCNVLQLHLTDDQGWRIGAGRPDASSTGAEPGTDDRWYTDEDLRALDRHAADLGITIVPEVDMPGHTSALLRLHPELATGRNTLTTQLVPGQDHHVAWLDPDEPRTFEIVAEVLASVAGIFAGPYLHLGGDEPFGMPEDLYRPFVRRAREVVRQVGKLPVGWQESARAGLDAGHVVQHWIDGAITGGVESLDQLPDGVRQLVEEITGGAAADLAAAVAAGARLLLSPTSHCYLDTRYAGASPDPEDEARRRRLGLPFYPRRTVEAFWDWDPVAAPSLAGVDGFEAERHLAGVSAALWSETIGDFADACFLVLPRLPGVADRAWRAGRPRDWDGYRRRLAAHGALWDALGLPSFRTTEVDWHPAPP